MKLAPQVEVTDEMLDAGADLMPEMHWNKFQLAQAYRAMRLLEPGPHQGAALRDVAVPTMGVRRV